MASFKKKKKHTFKGVKLWKQINLEYVKKKDYERKHKLSFSAKRSYLLCVHLCLVTVYYGVGQLKEKEFKQGEATKRLAPTMSTGVRRTWNNTRKKLLIATK